MVLSQGEDAAVVPEDPDRVGPVNIISHRTSGDELLHVSQTGPRLGRGACARRPFGWRESTHRAGVMSRPAGRSPAVRGPFIKCLHLNNLE